MSEIDWSRPIEAVHEDGQVVAVTHERKFDQEHETGPFNGSMPNIWNDDGLPWLDHARFAKGWRIRNVAQPTPERDPALWDRMETLVRRMGGNSSIGEPYEEDRAITHSSEHYYEARAIVAALPKPVDPDEEIARDLVRFAYPDMKPEYAGRRYQIALAAIKRGRALAAQDAARG